MATFYSTGPIQIWVGPQIRKPTQYTPTSAQGFKYLGTAEQTPQAEIRRQYHPAYNDLSGAVPFDRHVLGEDAIFAVDLTRWNESNYGIIASAPQQMGGVPTAGGIGLRGSYSAVNAMGALQAHEGNTITLYCVFPYGFPSAAPNLAGRSFGMGPGYRFHGGSLINDKMHQMGSKYRKLHLTFQFAPVYQYDTFDFRLYDHIIDSSMARPAA
jgi:hypothetical protein